ncbi:hypothetical protein ILYODFUR_033238 [Ilyodon furcidens]|uniref:Uncharacterized protein n=1 Tax=Ilyodon furcidens TaxID=33524 RepID=A0ABV0VLK7_9TELE
MSKAHNLVLGLGEPPTQCIHSATKGLMVHLYQSAFTSRDIHTLLLILTKYVLLLFSLPCMHNTANGITSDFRCYLSFWISPSHMKEVSAPPPPVSALLWRRNRFQYFY